MYSKLETCSHALSLVIWVIFELASSNDIGEIKMITENTGRNRHLNRKTQDKPEEYKEDT